MPKPLARKKSPKPQPFDKLEEAVEGLSPPPPVPQPCVKLEPLAIVATASATAIATTRFAVVFANCLHLPPVDCQYFTFLLLSFAAVVVAARSAVTVVC